ncbi:MAG: hypothetical protein AB7F22_35470 [Reyranella sp.]|uniref:hypothetical protein n=1 Tax=Reyranella sp. TaxID=1929291 RepID=UPI003D124364
MLTDEDRARIEAEERLRHAVRQSMQTPAEPAAPPPPPPKPGFGQRLYHFLNSSVGMWLLSSVLLTGGAAVLQQIQHAHEIAQKNQQDLTTLRFEIEHRLGNMAFLLRRAKTTGAAKTALDGVFKSPIPLTPELQNRTLSSLFLAAYPILPRKKQQDVRQAIRLVKRLEEDELLLHPLPDGQPLSDAQREKFSKTITSIQQLHLSEI